MVFGKVCGFFLDLLYYDDYTEVVCCFDLGLSYSPETNHIFRGHLNASAFESRTVTPFGCEMSHEMTKTVQRYCQFINISDIWSFLSVPDLEKEKMFLFRSSKPNIPTFPKTMERGIKLWAVSTLWANHK